MEKFYFMASIKCVLKSLRADNFQEEVYCKEGEFELCMETILTFLGTPLIR